MPARVNSTAPVGTKVKPKTKKALHDKYQPKTATELEDAYNKNLKDANRQKEVALRSSPAGESEALAGFSRSINDVISIAREQIRSGGHGGAGITRWRAFALGVDQLRDMLLATAEQNPDRMSYLGITSEAPLYGDEAAQDLVCADARIGRSAPADLDLKRIEGIDLKLSERLTDAGIPDLAALMEADTRRAGINGVSERRWRQFIDMAEFLVRFPQLSGNDAELLVLGIGFHDFSDLRTGAEMIDEPAVREAMTWVRLPATYDPAPVIALLEQEAYASGQEEDIEREDGD
jgi:hypothetical protein